LIVAAVVISRQKESVENNHPAEARTASAVVLEKDLRIGTWSAEASK
jgi:hypothetical protein